MAVKRITDLTAAGSLSGDELVEVSQLSSSVTISGSTISAQASDNSFNDSGAGFIAAGFAVGDRVNVTGFTGDVANNIVVGVIAILTTSKMNIDSPEGDVLVDDAAGETVTISKWVSRRATLQSVVGLVPGSIPAVTTDADDYTVLAADSSKYIRLTGASTKTITVQDEATQALPANGEWHFRNVGAGDATISPAGGVTVNVPVGGTLVIAQGGTVTLKRVAEDEFDLFGVTVAA